MKSKTGKTVHRPPYAVHRHANIELNIEHLILHGFSRQEATRIGKTMRVELSRLIAKGGLPKQFSQEMNIRQMDTGSFSVQQGAKPQVVGRQIAASVYKGFTSTK